MAQTRENGEPGVRIGGADPRLGSGAQGATKLPGNAASPSAMMTLPLYHFPFPTGN